ncbi:tetratricopeptide repeat protein [Aurantiacibacter luteus]|nr:tetratricopeptide repeat protein [Aurantiacibacter luteus]
MIRSRSLLLVAALAVPPLVPVAATAQQEVVQALPDPAQGELAAALQRLSRNPNSVPALVDAGRASLTLGDVSGALGFLNRAQAIDPDDGRVLSALALVAVRRGEAVTAIQLFDNAEAAGVQMGPYAGDRGLAYDLAGQPARAQRFYRQALSREESAEIVRRLALSYAISGDAAASETTLLPLLQRQDRAAFRTRAFALAILGRDEEAVSIATTMLPARLSDRLEPYLRFMTRLTDAQQAAAANLGRFPTSSEMGRDTPQIAALDRPAPAPAPQSVSSGDRLTPAGEPLGRQQATSQPVVQQLPAQQAVVQQPVVQQPVVQQPVQQAAATPPPSRSGELPAIESTEIAASQTPQRPVQPALAEVVAAQQAQPSPAPEPVVVASLGEPASFPPAGEARPSFSVGQPVAADPAPSREQIGLSEAFADFSLATTLPVVPSAGAVDIRTIEPRRDPPPVRAEAAPAPAARPAPPPPPAHPSRIWVQVATGQDLAAFRFDWRRLVRNSDGALEGRDAFTAPWNATNRLLTGPFDSAREANEFVTRLGAAGISAFRFTSTAGEEIRPLR